MFALGQEQGRRYAALAVAAGIVWAGLASSAHAQGMCAGVGTGTTGTTGTTTGTTGTGTVGTTGTSSGALSTAAAAMGAIQMVGMMQQMQQAQYMQQMYALEQMRTYQQQQDAEAARIQQKKNEVLAEKKAYRQRLAAERQTKVYERRRAARVNATAVASTTGAKGRASSK